jgi:2-deoxy-D-gluconate 3-dehydrogenase
VGVLDLFRLDNRIALVTGCGRGIGQAMALALAEAGADIAGLYTTRYEDTQQQIESLGRRFMPIQCDLERASVGELSSVVARVTDTFGRLDILVNNAGIVRRTPAADYSEADWDAVIQINLKSAFFLAQSAGRVMLSQPEAGGKIINVASLIAFQGGILIPAYAAAKHGLAGITKSLANEWAALNVNVNAIAPGYIATDNNTTLRADPVRSRQLLERIPAGHFGEPDDLKGVTVFLASDASRYVHGAIIPIDGAWLAR